MTAYVQTASPTGPAMLRAPCGCGVDDHAVTLQANAATTNKA